MALAPNYERDNFPVAHSPHIAISEKETLEPSGVRFKGRMQGAMHSMEKPMMRVMQRDP